MKSPVIAIVLVAIVCVVVVWPASGALYDFESPEQEARYIQLISELRCLVCQNQTLVDSNAELAGDLRDEVWEMMRSGQDDRQIVDFLVARYGDFVLYRPPLKRSTYLLWFGPFVFLAVAALLALLFVRRRRARTQAELSDVDRERLAAILGSDTSSTSGGDR